MQVKLWRYAGLSMAVAACITVGACKGRERAAASDTAMRGATTETAAGRATDTTKGANVTGAAMGTLSDANIVALLDEANMADSAAGAVAVKKATNADVRSFAKLMMGEHHALRQQGQALAKKLNITPEPPSNDPLKPMADQEMSALQSTPKGAKFDSTYIAQEVSVHQAVKDLATKARDQTKNDQLKALIDKASPVIQKHLDRAEQIQKRLGKTA
jgi:putative membrane protein